MSDEKNNDVENKSDDVHSSHLEARQKYLKHMEKLYGLELDDIDFVSDSKQALLITTPRAANLFLYAVIALLLIAIIWAGLGYIDETTIGQGKVIPSSKVKVIQSLEGGIIEEIFVKDGDRVKRGQPLLKLDDTRFKADYNEEYIKYLTLLTTIVRYRAEINGDTSIDFPQEVRKNAPELVKSETEIFKARMSDLKTSLSTMQRSYDLANKELNILKPLVKEQIMSDLELIRVQRQVNEIKGSIIEEKEKFKADAYKNFKNLQSEFIILQKGIEASRDRAFRTTIVSPVNGIVNNVNISTIGGVIPPGEDIMELVPLDDTLTVEVQVDPKDIAFIKVGDEAYVKFTAYDFAIFGGMQGKVAVISADTMQSEEGKSYYRVLVATDKNYLKNKKGRKLPILPGMMASVNIITSKKSVLDYILNPFFKATDRAFKEP